MEQNVTDRRHLVAGGLCAGIGAMAGAVLPMTAQADEATLEQQIHDLVAYQAITTQLSNYCRACDRLDYELGYSVAHEGAVFDYGEAVFQGTCKEFFDWVIPYHESLVRTCHRVMNVNVRIDGDEARSESYVLATLVSQGTGALLRPEAEDGTPDANAESSDEYYVVRTSCARYEDYWTFENGKWAIARRDFAVDFTHNQYVAAADFGMGTCKRDKTDISYLTVFAE